MHDAMLKTVLHTLDANGLWLQRSERIAIWTNDDLRLVAARFVDKHSLKPTMVAKLHSLLESRRLAVLSSAK